MPQKHLKEIRANPLFTDAADELFANLLRGAYVQNFPPHTELITEGEPADFLHIILSGCVELFSAWEGRETSMSFLCENATFIMAATIKDRPYLMSARTLSKSRVIMIPSIDIREAFETDAGFAKSIVTELAGCYRDTVKVTKNIKLRTSIERLANYLICMRADLGEVDDFELEIEKRRIASFLGMTPENLSRAFAGLRKYGVRVDGQKVSLSDPDALLGFAKPSQLIDGD